MTSSVDPTAEIAAIKTKLSGLSGALVFEGILAPDKVPVDGFGRKTAYRDLEFGSVIPSAGERLLAAHDQAQPHNWSFQVHHVAPTREQARALCTATDMALLGWAPTSNSGTIRPVFFTMFDEVDDNGALVEWIASRFYEVTLGMMPDMTITTP